MKALTLSFVAHTLHIEFKGVDANIKGVKADSRQVMPGDLFVAIKGERVDGHDYLQEAEEKGAIGVLASRSVTTKLPVLRVPDTIKALGDLAKAYRRQFSIPMLAITGSCGKTTVKELLTNICRLEGSVLSSIGNLNTEVGVPLTLLRLTPEHRLAVIEMGARQKGDIAYLMSLAEPSISLITNAGVAHLEAFGSRRNIAEAKGEIFEQLPANGTAVINMDDTNAKYWKSLLKPSQKVITFGFNGDPTITARNIQQKDLGSEFDLVMDEGVAHVCLPVPGKHMIQNALAAAAGARAFGISIAEIQAGLESFVPVKGRLQFKMGLNQTKIIDDSYNANPISMRAALAVLATAKGSKLLVMGDMLELGKEEVMLHQKIGEEAKALGIDRLFGVGALTIAAVHAFGTGASHYEDKPSLIAALRQHLNSNTTVLVKGSRGMRMEDVVTALTMD